MIKKLIFDLDNTLIMWEDKYIFALENVIKRLNLNYDEDKIKSIDSNIVSYEKYHEKYDKKIFLKYINKKCNINLPYKFVDMLIEEQGKCFKKFTKEYIDLFEYLKSKYELIIITNWFTETQKIRLKNAGILKYFSKVTGGDEHYLKPSLKAFDIIKNYEECVMIGDNIACDIEPALELGMQAILITKKNVKRDIRYKKISDLLELKEML